jgi:hypothetical protein
MEPGFAEVGAWLTHKALYNKLAADTSLMKNSPELHRFYDSIGTTNIGRMNEYEKGLTALRASIAKADTTHYKEALMAVNRTLTGISANNIPEENFVTVNNIYVNRLNHPKDTLTPAQIRTLAALAIQCPYVAGDAVYAARALLSQVDKRWYFDDVVLCLPPKSEPNKKTSLPDTNVVSPTSDFVKVFPNPTGNQLTVSFSASTLGQVQFEMINSLGQPVKQVVLPRGVNYITFDVSNLGDGIYHWSLRDNARMISSGKESIVR